MALSPKDRKERLHRLLLKVPSSERRRAALRVGLALAKRAQSTLGSAKARLTRPEDSIPELPRYLCSVWMSSRTNEAAKLEMEKLIERLRRRGKPRRSR